MGSCRHNLGAHNSVHFMMGLSCAYVAHYLCTIHSTASHLAQVCTQTVHTCNNTIGLSQWVWINPTFLCLHIKSTQSMQLQKSLYSFSAVDIHWERISESTLNFVYLSQVNSNPTKQPVKLRKNHYWDGNYKISFCGHVLITFNLSHCSTVKIFNDRTLSVEFLLK